MTIIAVCRPGCAGPRLDGGLDRSCKILSCGLLGEKKGLRPSGTELRAICCAVARGEFYAGFRSCRGMSAALRRCEVAKRSSPNIFTLFFGLFISVPEMEYGSIDRLNNGRAADLASDLTPAISLTQSLPSSPLAGPLHPLNGVEHGGSARREGNPVSTLDRHISRHKSLQLIMNPSLYLDRVPLRFNLAPYR